MSPLLQPPTQPIHQAISTSPPSAFGQIVPEILSQVFEQYILNDAKSPAFTSTGSPLTLSWVSPYWRTVALSTSDLWRSLRVLPRRDTSHSAKEESHTALLVELWLSRSGIRPLRIVFESLGAKGRVELGQPLFDVICQFANRWEDMDFVGCTFPTALLLHLVPGDLPYLRHCQLQEISVHNRELKPLLQDLLCSAPSLQTLRFKGSISPWLENLGSNVTSLSITDIYTSTHTHVIRGLLQSLEHTLEILAINISTWTPQWSTNGDVVPLVLPRLKSLSLHTDGSAAPFFDMTSLPSLIEFEFYHDYSTNNAPSFVSMFRRSRCPLQIISLRNSQVSAALMKECIELTNGSLRELHIHRAKVISASELCAILSPQKHSAPALQLRRLSFTEPRTLDDDSGEKVNKTFLDVLLERMRGAAGLGQPGLKYLHACVTGAEMRQLRKVVDTCRDVELKLGCSRRAVCVCLNQVNRIFVYLLANMLIHPRTNPIHLHLHFQEQPET